MKGWVLVAAIATATSGASLAASCSDYAGEDVPADAGADVSAADAGGAIDATDATDAAATDADPDAGPMTCPDGGFCDSFERSTVQGSWDTLNGFGPCTASIDDTTSTDGKSSLKIVLGVVDAGTCERYLRRAFVGSPKSLHVEYSVRVSSVPDRDLHFAGYVVPDPVRYLFFALRPGGLKIADQNPDAGFYADYPVGGLAPIGWHRVVLDYDVAMKRAVVVVDAEKRFDAVLTVDVTTTSYTFDFGITYSTPGTGFDIWFDDVRFVPTY